MSEAAPAPHDPDRPLTLSEAAALLNVSKSTMKAIRQSGAIPVLRIRPRCVRFRRSDILAYMFDCEERARRSRRSS